MRINDLIHEFETAESAAPTDAGGGPSPDAQADGEPAASAGETGAPPAAAPAWSPDDPAFRDAVREEAWAIVQGQQAREAPSGPQQAAEQAGGSDFDINAFLNPWDDNYGGNLAQFVQHSNQQLLGQVKEMLGPLMEDRQRQEASAGDELLRDAIHDFTVKTGDFVGGEDAQKHAVARVMASVRDTYYPEAAQMYGETDRAAELAIERAVTAERQYQKALFEAGAEDYKNRLGTLAGTPGEPVAGAHGATGTSVPGDAGSWNEYRDIDRRYAIPR